MNNSLKNLYQAIIAIENIDECKEFLDDICTIQEIEKMAQRLEAAKMLMENATYEQVIKETGISSATLSRVSKCVRYGDGGYKKIIDKIKE